MIHTHPHTPKCLNHTLPVGRRRCERCDRPLTPMARVRLCRPCRRRRPERLELAGYKGLELAGYKGPNGFAPPAEVDPGRAGRIERYAARAAAGLPLFASEKGVRS